MFSLYSKGSMYENLFLSKKIKIKIKINCPLSKRSLVCVCVVVWCTVYGV